MKRAGADSQSSTVVELKPKRKVINPYQRLLDEIKETYWKCRGEHRVKMWSYDQNAEYALSSLAQRVCAARQLGYDVELTVRDEWIHVWYIKRVKPEDFPWAVK